MTGERLRLRSGAVILAVFAALQGINWFVWGEDTTFRVFFAIYVLLPVMALALFVWWAFFCGLARKARGVGLAVVAALVGVFFLLVRIDGVDGVMTPKFSYRWSKSAEERARDFRDKAAKPPAVAANGNGTAASAASDNPTSKSDEVETPDVPRLEIAEDDWPRFRGPRFDSIVRGVTLRSDWNENPPDAVWRRPCGLGWSSFAVVGTRLFTQEQLGQDEAVVCYDAATGDELWRHTDTVRLDTSLGGDGPRATPTVYDSQVFALGGTGILNCLDALTGKKVWSTDILRDSGINGIEDANIDWGMSGSPLVDEERVYVNPGIGKSAPKKEAVAAYDRKTGKRVWANGANRAGYASPYPVTLDSVPQILLLDAVELASYDPETGRILWQFPFANNQGINVAQPFVVADRSVVVSVGYGTGSVRFDVAQKNGEWTTTERWRLANQFKLKFNDGVFRNGFVYGLDEGILACLDVETGQRRWRQGRYRYGEIVLVAGDAPADDRLVVISETGDLVLVQPSPEKGVELGRFKAIRGTCWNHPVIHRGRIYVRSEEEMACFDVGSPAKAP